MGWWYWTLLDVLSSALAPFRYCFAGPAPTQSPPLLFGRGTGASNYGSFVGGAPSSRLDCRRDSVCDEQFFCKLLGADAGEVRSDPAAAAGMWDEVERQQNNSWVRVPRGGAIEPLFLGYLATIESGQAGDEYSAMSAKFPGKVSSVYRDIEFDTFREFAEWHRCIEGMPLHIKRAYSRNCLAAARSRNSTMNTSQVV